jgi:hypothetical protein
MSASFEARYGGRCAECDEAIKPGQICNYVDDDMVHVDCESAITPEKPAEVCSECWMAKSVTGECGCAA